MPTDTPATFAFEFRVWIAVVALVLAAAAYLAYYRTTPEVRGRLRWVLAGLRLAAFLLLVLILLDPRIVRRSDRKEAPRVVALVDRSASMELPATGWDSGAPARFDAARRDAHSLEAFVDRRGGEFRTVYFSKGVESAAPDSVRPDGQGTDITGALQTVARRMEGENLTALVLFTDGVDTQDPLIRRAAPDVPVFAVGFGDTTPPEDVRIKEVDYNPVVRVPSRTRIEATLAYTGGAGGTRRVSIRLQEGNRRVFQKDTLFTPASTELVTDIPVEFEEAGRREFVLSVSVEGRDAEPDNNRRDIVIEAEKAQARILIVDMLPDWELHFLTDFLRRDQTFDFDIVSAPGRQARDTGAFIPAAEFIPTLAECDALVLASVTGGFLTPEVSAAIVRFVRERGGGLLVMPGTGSLFESPTAWNRLDEILPVRGSPPFRFNLQYTGVLPGAQAAGNPITAHLLPLFSQTEWQERSPLLGYYGAVAAKPVSDVLLAVRGRSLPAVTYRTVEKGRVAVVSAGPLWRWKFLSEKNTVYDEMVSRLLDVLSRGEETDRFVMTSTKNVFDAGESPEFYAEIFNEKMQPVTGVPVQLEVSRVDADGDETPLDIVSMSRESTQNTRFRAELAPLAPGRYMVRGSAELADRTVQSRPLEVRVSETSVEFQRVNQDRAGLVALARRSGGAYAPAGGVDAVAAQLSLEPRTIETVTEINVRASVLLFLAIIALLGVEWLLRKRAGMI